MPGTFAYTRSTNTLVVTGGTSGSPADFASMLTADRAGSVTLLAAWTPSSNTKALTYQIAPAEVLALLISFVVASKTTSTDYIFITGTDAWGNAQTESIDVSAGNGTYVSTKRFRTITNIDCSDNAAGGGTVWADGTIAVTQPQWGVVWDFKLGFYKIGAHLSIGDGSTSTWFQSTFESVAFEDLIGITVYGNATIQLGKKVGDHGVMGSYWSFLPDYYMHINLGGTVNIYASAMAIRQSTGGHVINFASGTNVISNALLLSYSVPVTPSGRWNFGPSITSISFKNVMLLQGEELILEKTPAVFENVHVHYFQNGIYVPNADITANNLNMTSSNAYDIMTYGTKTITLIDPVFQPTAAKIFLIQDGSTCEHKVSFMVTVIDKNGDLLADAVVDLEDKDGVNVWTEGSIETDVNGVIPEQYVMLKTWEDSTIDETVFSPHILTISKTGYQTIIIPEITIDAAIDWTVELQPAGTANMSRVRVGH